ncbi:MAG: hypothetical protein ACI3V4_13030 [Faecousia sp.]
MAERRMFSRTVIGSARFLRMPATSRLLYYDLGMDADDDGCVEAFGVMRKTGATEDDLKVLASKGFIRILNEDLVAYILDWNKNNQIRKDRYHEGVYKDLIGATCNVLIEDGNHVTTEWQPSDNQMETEVRLGKDSIDKDSIREADKPPTRSRFVPPSAEEVAAYCNERGYTGVDPERFVDYYTSNGWKVGRNSMKDWKATVRRWNNQDRKDAPTQPEDFELVDDGNGGKVWRAKS